MIVHVVIHPRTGMVSDTCNLGFQQRLVSHAAPSCPVLLHKAIVAPLPCLQSGLRHVSKDYVQR